MFNLIVKISPKENLFLDSARAAMECYFGADQRRIEHALQVSFYARELLAYIEADPVLTLASAYLHDIGIPEAERKHGSSAGNWQEIEGPPIARTLLSALDAAPDFVDNIAAIVGNHHTCAGVDSPEFRIIWDADALVNFAGAFTSKSDEQIEAILKNHMVTEPGFRMARKLFLHNAESHNRCPTTN